MYAVADRNLWAMQHADCTAEPHITSLEEARFVLATHAGHSGCAPFAAAHAYSFGRQGH